MDELKIRLKNVLRDKADVTLGGGEIEDSVRLGEPGWKERYYEEKFLVKSPDEMEAIQQDVVCLLNRSLFRGTYDAVWGVFPCFLVQRLSKFPPFLVQCKLNCEAFVTRIYVFLVVI